MNALGYVSSWDPANLPEEYQTCVDKRHAWERILIWRSISMHVGEYECPVCQIKYRVDSSD